MRTHTIFKDDVFQTSTSANIISYIVQDEHVLIELDQTVFFPGGGGQSCDRGFLTIKNKIYPVLNVFEDNCIYHEIAISDYLDLSIGCEVLASIDWNFRFLNMQRHAGEHILSGVIHELCNGINKGFHMGNEYMTIDILMPQNEILTPEMLQTCEDRTNQIIWKNAPIYTTFFKTNDMVNIPLRKPLTLEKDITIVSVCDTCTPSYSAACCGTHPKLTGNIGLIKILKYEKNKDMYRIYLEAGQNAMNIFKSEHDILQTIAHRLSSSKDDIISKFDIMQDNIQLLKDELVAMNKLFTKSIQEAIDNSSNTILLLTYDSIPKNQLSHIGKSLNIPTNMVLVIATKDNYSSILFSNSTDCNEIIQKIKNLHDFVKGGGGKNTGSLKVTTLNEYNMLLETIRQLNY